MAEMKIAMSWAAACGGCDVSLLDTEMRLLDLTAVAEVVFWPVAMDFKRDALLAVPDQSVDIGLFNGAIRTSEQAEDALLFRQKCKLLVAYGACASFGGVPGLGNLAPKDEILEVAYGSTPSTENPEGLRPSPEFRLGEHTLTLPAFASTTRALSQVVAVDAYLPGCPPPTPRVLDLIAVAERYAESGAAPPSGTVLAEDKALCETCPRRASRDGSRLTAIRRPQEVIADDQTCLLTQGLLCLGIATRGGCGASCIEANMPCRGCFGPTADALDPAAEAISAVGSLAGAADENDVPAHVMKKVVRSIKDPAGTFYRFTLASSLFHRAVVDAPQKD